MSTDRAIDLWAAHLSPGMREHLDQMQELSMLSKPRNVDMINKLFFTPEEADKIEAIRRRCIVHCNACGGTGTENRNEYDDQGHMPVVCKVCGGTGFLR